MKQITIDELSLQSMSRAHRWHNGDTKNWSLLEWAAAMAGEAGETCNAAKKLKRIEDEIPNFNVGNRSLTEMAEAKRRIAHEACDTILYAILVVSECGEDLEGMLREVFNKKSEEYGFPERI